MKELVYLIAALVLIGAISGLAAFSRGVTLERMSDCSGFDKPILRTKCAG
jgi:hypothetical protein